MTTTRAYNTSPNRLMIDSAGHGIDPATWRTADPADPVTARLISAGLLITATPDPTPEPEPTSEPPAPAGKGSKKGTN